MAVSQELVAKFKADTSDFTKKVHQVNRDINEVGRSGRKMGDDLEVGTNKATASLSVMSSRLAGVATAIGAAAVAVGAFSIKVGSDMETATKRIEGMLGSAEKANFVIAELRNMGYETGASVVSLADSYGKLAVFVQNGSITLQESIALQGGLTNTATALGASTEQLATVMYGLSQAMGSGVVRAEEFNQVTEPLPGIINRMEEATGLASGELRKMINDGLITSEMFKDILIPALASFETQAVQMSDTFKVQSGILSNTFAALGEDIYNYLESPLASATAAANDFLQTFLSVQRASQKELQRRRDTNQLEIMSLQANLASTGDEAFKSALDTKVKEQFEINRQLATFIPDKPSAKKSPSDTPKKEIPIDSKVKEDIQKLRLKLKGGGKSAVGGGRAVSRGGGGRASSGVSVRTEAQKQQDEEMRIRESAIASAKQSIATAEAEVETMRMLSHEKKIAIELNKLQAVGLSENSEQYKTLSQSIDKAFTAEMRMRETLDLEKYVRDKKNETEAIADQAKFIGMTSHEIAQYNLHKQLQIDLEEKSLVLTREGFEAYKKTAEETVERQSQLMEQNKAYQESFEGGVSSLMTRLREDMLTEADLVSQGYEIMSSNISDTLVSMAQGSKASFKDMARSIISDIQGIIMKALIMRAVTGIVNSFMPTGGATAFASQAQGQLMPNDFGGMRANGGRVLANKSYLVGERGAEILTMGSNSGYVTSNDQAFGGGKSGAMVVNIDARGASNGVEQDIRRVMNEVMNLRKQVPNIAISAVREQNSRSSGFLK